MVIRKTKQKTNEQKEKKQCGTFYLKMYECIYFIKCGKSSETTTNKYFTSFKKKSIKIPKEKI